MQLTKRELIEKLLEFPDETFVLIEKESDVAFSGVLTVKRVTVDYEHSDESIEEMECIVISDEL